MKKPQIFVVCLSLLLGYIAATALNRTSAGQPPAPVPVDQEGQQVWRYQLTAYGDGRGAHPTVLLTDTVTGRVWVRYPGGQNDQWQAFGSPDSRRTERAR
jgi:hypothetical protein